MAISRLFEKLRSRYKSKPQATDGASPTPLSTQPSNDGNQLVTESSHASTSGNAPSKLPLQQPASAPLPAHIVATTTPLKVRPVKKPAASGPNTGVADSGKPSPPTLKNNALQKAIEKHAAELSEHERRSCMQAFRAIPETDILQRVAACDQNHHEDSKFRQYADKLGNVFGVLDKFLKIVSPNASASPEATIAIGAIRAVLDIALSFLGFFGKLTSMICRLGDYLAPLAEYAKIPQDQTTLINSLSAVYGDFLVFCQKAHAVFVDEWGCARKMTAFRVFWRVQWMPFEAEFGSIEDDLRHHLQVLQHSSSAIAVSAALDVRAHQEARDKEDLLNWLSDFPYEERHEERYSKKHPGTGDWLLRHDRFQDWIQSNSSTVLWCHGGPGTGKSFLAANVLEHATSQKALDEDVGIAFVYYDYQAAEQQNRSHVVRAMLKQLCRTRQSAPEHLLEAKRKALPVGSVEDLKAVAGAYRELFVVVDALDECKKDNRPEIISVFREMLQSLPLVKVFVTSRPEPDISRFMEDANTPTLMVDASFMGPDIEKYVTDEVRDLRLGRNSVRLYIKSDELAEEVVRTLIERADGMFLWVHLQLQNLCKVSEDRKDSLVRQALISLPKGLHSTYARISQQIMDQPDYRRSLGIRCLRWVLYAQRPLHVAELQYALATFEEGSDVTDADLDSLDVILGACANLIVCQSAELGLLVRPVHYSVQEYFTGEDKPLRSSILQTYMFDQSDAHATLSADCFAHLCQPFMRSGDFNPITITESERWLRVTQDRFLHYAASYFDAHLLETDSQIAYHHIDALSASAPGHLRSIMNTRATTLRDWRRAWFTEPDYTLETYKMSNRHKVIIKPTTLINDLDTDWTDYASTRTVWTASSIVASTNLLLSPEIHHGYVDREGLNTALHYACRALSISAVYQLLADGADVNRRDVDGRTPLHLAILAHDEDLAQCLLARGANPSVQDNKGSSVLQMAVLRMNLATVRLLVERGANVNDVGGYWHTSLQVAAYIDDMAKVRYLVTAGADIDVAGGPFGSALHIASYSGNTEMVTYLLDNGADINIRCDEIGDPLSESLRANSACRAFPVLLRRGARIEVEALIVAAEKLRVRELSELLLELDKGPRYSAIDIGAALVAAWRHRDFSSDPERVEEAAIIARVLQLRLAPSEQGMKVKVRPDVKELTIALLWEDVSERETDSEVEIRDEIETESEENDSTGGTRTVALRRRLHIQRPVSKRCHTRARSMRRFPAPTMTSKPKTGRRRSETLARSLWSEDRQDAAEILEFTRVTLYRRAHACVDEFDHLHEDSSNKFYERLTLPPSREAFSNTQLVGPLVTKVDVVDTTVRWSYVPFPADWRVAEDS